MRVRYTLPALAELDAILDFLATRSPQGAARVKARIRNFVDLLPSYPLIGAKTDDPTIRRLVMRPYPYLVFYEAGQGEIIVHSFRHTARESSKTSGQGST